MNFEVLWGFPLIGVMLEEIGGFLEILKDFTGKFKSKFYLIFNFNLI